MVDHDRDEGSWANQLIGATYFSTLIILNTIEMISIWTMSDGSQRDCQDRSFVVQCWPRQRYGSINQKFLTWSRFSNLEISIWSSAVKSTFEFFRPCLKIWFRVSEQLLTFHYSLTILSKLPNFYLHWNESFLYNRAIRCSMSILIAYLFGTPS